MAIWNFAKNLQKILTTNTINTTLTTIHTHWSTNTTMVALNRTITTQNNAHKLQPHLTQQSQKS